MHDLWYYLGLTSPNDWPYLAFSGVVPCLALLGGAWSLIRRHNCHQPGCWRIGRVERDGRIHCHRHHQGTT